MKKKGGRVFTEETRQGKKTKDFKMTGRAAVSQDPVWPGQPSPAGKADQVRSEPQQRCQDHQKPGTDQEAGHRQTGPGQLLQTKRKIRILLQKHLKQLMTFENSLYLPK